jgi:hypothetical protein
MPPPKTFVSNVATRLLQESAAAKKMKSISNEPGLKALSNRVVDRGFAPKTKGKDAYFGVSETIKSNDGKVATFEVYIQSYTKTGSKDVAAVGVAMVKSGKNSSTYQFSLMAPGGDFENAIEHRVDKSNRVLKANSWFTRWRSCLRSRCIATCLGALTTCSGTWAAYFWCVVAACGGCVLRCAGCASCNCSFWCRWAVGCCD